ncbi:uncharacterized protein METZ01_LOCUS493993, partial [marine metagenome]
VRILTPYQHISELGTGTVVVQKLWSMLLFLLCMLPINTFANDELISVAVDAVELVQIDTPTAWIQIGNPDIADVSVNTSRSIIVLGLAVGETGLLLLDDGGEVIKNLNVIVEPRSERQVKVYRGPSAA